jgi:hypothetical protein
VNSTGTDFTSIKMHDPTIDESQERAIQFSGTRDDARDTGAVYSINLRASLCCCLPHL